MLPPVMRSRSLRFSGIAWTRTSSSPASGVGTSTVSRHNTSRGAPYSWVRHARIDLVPFTVATLTAHSRVTHVHRDGSGEEHRSTVLRDRVGVARAVDDLSLPEVVCLALIAEQPRHGW